MSLEDALKENTAAVLAHTQLLQDLSASKGGDAAKPTRTRRTNAQIEADNAAAAAAAEKGGDKGGDARDDRRSRQSTDASGGKNDDVETFKRDLKDWLNDGDAKEQELRTGFIEDMNKHFGVESARDIPAKNYTKVRRWMKIYGGGNEVDFDND